MHALGALLALGLLAAGCGGTEGGGGLATTRLQASAAALRFEPAFVGQRREGMVRVLNAGERPLRVTFRSDSPAFTAPEPLELPSLGYREVQVQFAPEAVGLFAGRLRVEGEGGEAVEVELEGRAAPAPRCEALGPCRTAHLDVEAGVCTHALAPDGTACGANACAGVCAAGTCVTDSGELSAAWRYAQPEGKKLNFPGLVDAEGNVYWFEYVRLSAGADCELVSASRQGLPRYRVALGKGDCASTAQGTLLVSGDDVVLGVNGPPEWRRREDGSLRWRPELADTLGFALGVPGSALQGTAVWGLAARSNGDVYALVHTATQQAPASLLLRLQPAQRAVHVLTRFEQGYAPTRLLLDEGGWVYVGDEALHELRALDAQGNLRWRAPQVGTPRAAWGVRVWTDGGQVLDAQTGALLYGSRGAAWMPSPVGGDALAFAWTNATEGRTQLSALDVRTGLPRWSVVTPQPSRALYTARGSVLLPVRPGDGRSELREVSAEGQTLQAPALCEQETVQGDWALHAGRVFALATAPGGTPQVRAYDLPQRVEPAERGWAVERGTVTRASTAR
ncbi:hypothetical protein FGE12_23680 [Aggregicoccus sp. 17bor-14]|uniref:PQQ-binding-like beta-propeller repeat protein n=1 Tax=Myxococcaceae TaxID=31 RepID=UPI00129C8B01|nr:MULTISPECIES: PQQ-binding-like beta-propeller repeat protein [Myxococcaceae]MBF5045427.1 PQQ-like beta-propeller repeat protein [Simulacricoccus sp. 17bor-14]MRI91168.1 hypothetical protein [Aggregicoccus sp. 17bor-14]